MAVKKAVKPGRYNDGSGLYLRIYANGNRAWVFRWRDRITNKLRDKGLGPCWDVTLEQARAAAKVCREQVRAGMDPIGAARATRETKRIEIARRLTFGECSQRYIDAHRAGWRNAKHAEQWTSTLSKHAALLNPLQVADITTDLVVQCLEPIWAKKTETATRVRQRIECVLDWAKVRGLRRGDNPARWRGHLDTLLPEPAKLKKVTPRAALPYLELGAFMAKLKEGGGIGARALELQILTATRPGEAAGMRWAELDLDTATWTIPGSRMKAGIAHRVPLSSACVALLNGLPRSKGAEFVFPGPRGKTLTTAALLKAARAIRANIDAHGFRSSFRDWAAERTSYPREVVEAALAHRLKDKAEAAYFRSDLLEKRAKLMQDWANFGAEPAKQLVEGEVQ